MHLYPETGKKRLLFRQGSGGGPKARSGEVDLGCAIFLLRERGNVFLNDLNAFWSIGKAWLVQEGQISVTPP